ncbi:hypothetical protein [Comamonas sp. JC664]
MERCIVLAYAAAAGLCVVGFRWWPRRPLTGSCTSTTRKVAGRCWSGLRA